MKGVQESYMKNISKNDKVYELDSDILDSIGLPPNDYTGPRYNIRALDKYCKSKNITASNLTEEELKQFEVND